MRYLLYAVGILLGLIAVTMLGVAAAALVVTVRDEFRRRHEKDLPPRIAALRQDFFREDIERLRGVKLWFLWYEDRFDLENSMSFGISVHFSEEGARAEFDKRSRPLMG